jgi:hypothetical protein
MYESDTDVVITGFDCICNKSGLLERTVSLCSCWGKDVPRTFPIVWSWCCVCLPPSLDKRQTWKYKIKKGYVIWYYSGCKMLNCNLRGFIFFSTVHFSVYKQNHQLIHFLLRTICREVMVVNKKCISFLFMWFCLCNLRVCDTIIIVL